MNRTNDMYEAYTLDVRSIPTACTTQKEQRRALRFCSFFCRNLPMAAVFRRRCLLEQREIDAAIGPMLDEMGMGREVVLPAVLKNKEPVWRQKIGRKDQVGKLLKVGKLVWRIGKDKVEGLLGRLQKTENVAPDEHVGSVAQLLYTLLYEAGMVFVELYADHLRASPGEQFERNASSPGKKVERPGRVIVDICIEHIKDILLGKVGRGPCLEGARDVKVPSLVFSCDDSQNEWC